ncbi:MAG TPA: thiamine pyrophosphate-binding protein [Candidatus Binataceae bacterium]|nr:thiamine pyrophosphate-binding protein [Candidatus Binataceae bacterium]
MKRHMMLGDFLLSYLRKLGVEHVFGIPGDLALKLFFTLGRKHGLHMITLSHEPGVGFAADGYARATGRVGLICVTYGAGGHNLVNAVAGAYSERVPLLIFSGGPGEGERKLGTLIHHQAREVESQLRIFKEVTCSAAVLTNPRTAAEDLHAVVKAVWAEQRPGYIEIHRDMVDREIEVPAELGEWDGRLHFPATTNSHRVQEAARETAALWNASRQPILVVGIETRRYKLEREILTLAERLGAPVLSTFLAKGAFPMDHPLFMGVQIGELSAPPIVERLKAADLMLNLGCERTDMNYGNRPPHINYERTVWAAEHRVDIRFHSYTEVGIRDFVRELLRQDFKPRHEPVYYADNLQGEPALPRSPLRVRDLLRTVNDFLAQHAGYAVIADSGDMLFAGMDIRVPNGGLYLAQGFYASMGFSVPAALGLQLGVKQRPLVMVGDGAFQMTGMEIAHAPLLRLNPIVVVINNGGWQIFRPVVERPDLLAIPSWPYAKLGQDWGGRGFLANTVGELQQALEEAHKGESFALIEARLAMDDLSPVSLKYIEAAARRSRAPAQPAREPQ